MVVHTIGHSTRTLGEFTALLDEAGVKGIADVRAFPMSRRHPHFNKDPLAASLAAAGIDYQHIPALGGRRHARKGAVSRNGFWKVEAFRNYADYAETPEFAAAIAELEAFAHERPTAFMCAEAVWWQCHRRLIADYMLARGWRVVHILAAGKQQPASLTEGAVVHRDGTLEYPPPQPRLV
jgi:uncharacterized protein (DUF488 family)